MSEVNVGIGTLCNVEASFDGVNLNVNVEVCPAGAEFTQIQSDWNQSDNTAVDYIKNKPAIAVSRVGVNLTGSGTVLDPLKFQAVDWAAETLYRTLQLIIYEGELYRVTTEFTSGATFDDTNLERIEPKVATPVTPDYTAITVGDKLQEVAEKVAGLQESRKLIYSLTTTVQINNLEILLDNEQRLIIEYSSNTGTSHSNVVSTFRINGVQTANYLSLTARFNAFHFYTGRHKFAGTMELRNIGGLIFANCRAQQEWGGDNETFTIASRNVLGFLELPQTGINKISILGTFNAGLTINIYRI
jgi:hypothetical protein